MKKNIAYVVLSLFLLFIVINYKLFFSLFYNFLWNYYYNSWDYSKSLVFHSRSHNYKSSNEILYNIWNDFYRLWNYNLAIKNYDKLFLSWDKDVFLSSAFNLANSLYKLWEEEKDIRNKINLWISSLNLYLNLLSNKEDKKVRDNYNFVKKKLEELESESQDSNDNSEDWSNDNDSNYSWQEEDSNEDWSKQWIEWEEWDWDKSENEGIEYDTSTQSWYLSEREEIYKLKLWEDISEISDIERQKVKEYIDFLKSEQEKNKLFFDNKKNLDINPDNSFLEILKNDPFFKDIFEK